MQTIVLYLCYIVLILLFSTAYNTSLIYCPVIWCLHTNKRRPCSSTLSGHPSSSFVFPRVLPSVGYFKETGRNHRQSCQSAFGSAVKHLKTSSEIMGTLHSQGLPFWNFTRHNMSQISLFRLSWNFTCHMLPTIFKHCFAASTECYAYMSQISLFA